MDNQFQRSESILGAQSTARLKECRVAVFGAGGVGGYTIEALARSGIGTIDIIDSDRVDITNLNRQIIALHETIGRFKTDVFEERIHSICSDIKVNKFKGFYLPFSSSQIIRENDPENILSEKDFDFTAYDYIVDAIDTVSAKISLIQQAYEADTPVISAMGCGNRIDPSQLTVTDIFKTHSDPLAKVIRKKLRELGIRKLKVVYSLEEPLKPDHQGKNGQNRSPGSTPFVPAAAGLLIASVVVRDLLSL